MRQQNLHHIVQVILHMLNCKLKVINPYNYGSSRGERQINTISDIIVKHLWHKGQMWPLFVNTVAYAMHSFASEVLNGFSPFQLVFVRDPPDLTSLSFPKIDTIPVIYRKYYTLLLARAQMVGRLLLDWRTQQALEYENRHRQFTKEEMFEDDQNGIFASTTFISVANQYNKIQTRLHWPIIHRCHLRQDPL